MTCKICTGPDAIPAFLCRACHPELIPTPEAKAEAEAVQRAEADATRKRQELLRVKARLASIESNPKASGVDLRIAKGLRKKLARLEGLAKDKSVTT